MLGVGAFHSESCVTKILRNSRIEIEKLNGQSYELWKMNMEDILVDK